MADTLHIFWHPDCFKHDTGSGCYNANDQALLAVSEMRPENAERLLNIKSILEKGPLSENLIWHQGRPASRTDIERFTDPALIELILKTEEQAVKDGKPIAIDDSETMVSAGTWQALQAAAGCSLDALDAVMSGETKQAYCLIRPPGHHASRTLADGYCMVNNIGVVAEHALAKGVKRIAVLDWDVHHGNGTQTAFYDREDVLTISLHMPLGAWGKNHPETGEPDEVGTGRGKGFNLNIPVMYGSGDQAYIYAMTEIVEPAVDAFKPELLLIANGQDANQFDLNGRNMVSMDGFRKMGQIARNLADRHCDGRLILFQEGGYALSYTAFCAYASLEGALRVKDPLQDNQAYRKSTEQPEEPIAHLEKVKNELNELLKA